MNIRIKFDHNKLKIGSDGNIENFNSNNNPFEGGFLEFDLNFFNIIYQMFSSNIINYFNAINKEKWKPIHTDQHSIEFAPDQPGILPVNGHDIYNYVARFGSANYQIQTVMKLNGRLNPDKLIKAVRLSIDAEPVFGCRLVENTPPYWKRLDDVDKIKFCTFEETEHLNEAVMGFLESPLDMDHEPMVKLRLIRSGLYDTLCMKINHTCCDGTGVKEYLQLLSDIYSRIDQNNDIYVPKSSIRSRKDQDRLFSALGINDPEAEWNGQLDIPKTMWPFPWRPEKTGITRVAVCKLPKGYVDRLSKYAKARGATINDLILTAFYRAMFKFSQPQQGVPMNISMTVDLRRYLPNKKTEAIRNFSAGIDTKLARLDHEPFEGTLSRVVPMMNEIKENRPGVQSAIGLERVEKAKFNETLSYYMTAAQNAGYCDKCSPVLSNLGFINRSFLKFGKTDVTDAFIVPPAVCEPGILLCIGTYNEIITMAVSYYEAQVREEDMNRLLNLIKNELVGSCRP